MKTVNQLIKERRDSGMTLQGIGDEFGCTRENIRLILIKYYGTAVVGSLGKALLTTLQLANLVNCSNAQIGEFHMRGVISPANLNSHTRLWDSKAVSELLRIRSCRICNRIIPKYRSVYCSNGCRIEGSKYKNRSDEAKKKQNECARHWQKEHPERTKEIQDSCARRYLIKRKAISTEASL